MKKILLIAIGLLAISSLTQAQNRLGLKFGIKAGINYSQYHGEDSDIFFSKPGFNFGGYARYLFSDDFNLQLEAIYNSKGAAVDLDIADRVIEVKELIHYIEFPVLLKFYPAMFRSGVINFAVEAGGYIAMKTNTSLESDDGLTEQELPLEDINSIDAGFIVGGSFEFPMESGGDVNFDVRFVLGQSEVDKTRNLKNQAISFTLGYTF